MTDRFEFSSHEAAAKIESLPATSQRRALELELMKVRCEAEAARLEARAAEIEALIRRFDDSGWQEHPGHRDDCVAEQVADDWLPPCAEPPCAEPPCAEPPCAEPEQFTSWDQVRSATATGQARGERAGEPPSACRVGHAAGAAIIPPPLERRPTASQSSHPRSRRHNPKVWLLSFGSHGLLLVLLAAFTLGHRQARDQIAIAAAVTDPLEQSIESIQIEAAQPTVAESEADPLPQPLELSPLGELAAIESPTQPQPGSSSLAAMFQQDSSVASTSLSAPTMSDLKMEFCGVSGGGNHFVYLVDSSASMGDGFDSARRELLQSIELLKPQQRFYVIFFDDESDYMRLSDPNHDEPTSVFATPENKRSLARWAAQISIDRGRAPQQALQFALQLRPDVIFLLSDGEFPQSIEDLLRSENSQENLFGDSGPICIVHTIAYHSQSGESRMRRIAQQNRGQYRYVPKGRQ